MRKINIIATFLVIFGAISTNASTSEADNWWNGFGDSTLVWLIDRAEANNYDIAMAVRRVEIARAAVGTARSAYYPQISISAGYDRLRTSGLMNDPETPITKNGYWNIGAQMSWEIDVFGKITRRVKGAKQAVKVSAAERAGVELSVAAQVASTYIDLRMSQAELEVARQHMASQDSVLKIAEVRFDTGLASMMDVDQAQQVYYSTAASIPMLENTIGADMRALAVLTGQEPDALTAMLTPVQPLPQYLQLVESTVPAELVRRRPDVIAAERQVDVAASQVGIARSQWLPSLAIQGSIGWSAHKFNKLFYDHAVEYSLAPALSWTVFDGLARTYGIRSAKESLKEAVDNYNLTLLTAMQEAEDAMATYRAALQYIEKMQLVVVASENYDRRAVDNYRSGLSPFINVADAQMSYLSNMNSLIVAKGRALSALVALFKALGGGVNPEL